MLKHIREVLRRTRFWNSADRIGPDLPLTHWRLHFPSTMESLCAKKFQRFGNSADFRPGAYAVACSKISIGSRVVIRPQSMLFADPREGGAGIVIEDDVLIGSGVHIYVSNHRFDDCKISIIDQGHYASMPVVLRRGCWVGACCIILPGVEIGENSVVGAGSVVTRSVPANVVVAGSPARVLKNLS